MNRICCGALLTLALSLTTVSVASANARDDKVQLYIEVHNQFARSIRARFDRYTEALQGLNADAPCQGDQNPGRAIYHAGDATGTIRAFRRRLRRRPRLPQDQLITTMLDAAAEELPAWNAAFAYYSHNRHREDACAEGNRLHATMIGAMRRFVEADTQLIAFLDTESREQRRREIADVEREHGQGFRYAHLTMVAQVEALRDLLRVQRLDLAAIGRVFDTLDTMRTQTLARVQAADPDIRSALYEGRYQMFLQRVASLVRAGRTLLERLNDPRANADRRRRAGEALNRALSEAIRSSNGVRYRRDVH